MAVHAAIERPSSQVCRAAVLSPPSPHPSPDEGVLTAGEGLAYPVRLARAGETANQEQPGEGGAVRNGALLHTAALLSPERVTPE